MVVRTAQTHGVDAVAFAIGGALGGASGGALGHGIANNPSLSLGQSVATGAAAGAAAGLIIAAIINMYMGQINHRTYNPDPKFVAVLREITKSPVIIPRAPSSQP